jgi:predicted cupin superfamily sugar epimerase
MKPAEYWIKHLRLEQHPEGGFYKESYRASEKISTASLPRRFTGDRNFSTSIYFLLRSQDRSMFHKIKSDELWHYHAGSRLTIYILDNGKLVTRTLGSDLENGESLQVVIPANVWFGAKVEQPDSYSLSGCTVSPGFDFADFELGEQNKLLAKFPGQTDIIRMLT